MTIEITMAKTQDGRLAPLSESDTEQLAQMKIGQGVRVTLTQQSARSLKHHQMFFAGLVPLVMQYWNPTGGLMQPAEKNILRMFCKRLDGNDQIDGPVWKLAKQFIKGVERKRGETYQSPNKSVDDFMYWLKLEVGHYDVLETPSGLLRRVKSINFNSMSQEEFSAFYKKAHDVCWVTILQYPFEGKEEECNNVINQMMSMS